MASSVIPRHLVTPVYTFADADRLADLSRGTAKRWLRGYRYRSLDGALVERPAVTPGRAEYAGVSFLDLVELIGTGRLLKAGFSLGDVRRMVAVCVDSLGEPYPWATLKFKFGGRDIFVDRDEVLVDVLKQRGNMAWDEILAPFLDELDYDDNLAHRWWPRGRAQLVIIDPEYGFGQPVVANSGVRTEIILERRDAGDSIKQIASDFNLTGEQVKAAIEYQRGLEAA